MPALPRIVFIIGPESDDDWSELRYALRAVDRNVPFGSVAIAGHRPAWVRGVEHLPTVQDTGDKHRNIARNFAAACERFERWLLFWDDVFIMQPMAEIPVMHGGPIRERVAILRADGSTGRYVDEVERAGLLLESVGFEEPLAFDSLHVPYWIESAVMRRAMDFGRSVGSAMVITFHGNFAGLQGERTKNAKVRDIDQVGSRRIISTNAPSWRGDLGRDIRSILSTPSRFEKVTTMSEYPNLDTSLSLDSVRDLFDRAAAVPRTQAVVELGVYKGNTTRWLALGAKAGKGARVFGVDLWDAPSVMPRREKFVSARPREIALERFEAAGVADVIELVQGDTVEVASSWSGPKVGLLFVDAGRTYVEVKRDVNAWRPHMARGGVVAIDDYCDPGLPGVREAVDQLLDEGVLRQGEVIDDRIFVAKVAQER